MKRLAFSLALLACLGLATVLTATASFAGPPIPGTYSSTDIGGTIPPGRYSEGWGPGGGGLLSSATLNCGSWDGTSLGLVWRYICATQLTNAVLILDTVDGSGNGQRTWKCTYSGGTFWLSGTGPWANGDPDYPGVFDSYVEFETVLYSGGIEIGAVTIVQASAHFDNYPTICMSYGIGSGQRVGTTALGQVEPPNYPPFLQAGTCAPVMPEGAWWNMNGVTLSITSGCAVPTRPSTWGAVKTLYR
jgi:hypothetical protein